MASLYDISVGQEIELKRILADAGFDAKMAEAILRDPQKAREWVDKLREQLQPPAPAHSALFGQPEGIFNSFATWNSRNHKRWFTPEQLEQLRSTMPADFPSRLDSVLSLDIRLGDLSTTFDELWSWNQEVHPNTWRYDGLKSDKKHLRLLDPKRYGNQPSVRWVVLDLTANRGQAPKDVRNPANSPGLSLLAAAALHPDWPPAINYDTVPGVWLPGLEATIPGGDAWRHVPVLYGDRYDRTVRLLASWDDRRGSDYAVPVFREL